MELDFWWVKLFCVIVGLVEKLYWWVIVFMYDKLLVEWVLL